MGQIVLGGITVLFDLWPPLVMGHFILSALIVANAVILHHRAGRPDTPGVPTVSTRGVQLGRLLVAAAAAVLVTGTVVTGSGPHGGDEHVKRLPFFVEDVARIHSLTAWVFLALGLTTLWRIHHDGATPALERAGMVLVAAVVVQGAIGYTQYFTGVPPGLVLVHIAGSVLVWGAALHLYLSMWAHPGVEPIGTVRAEHAVPTRAASAAERPVAT